MENQPNPLEIFNEQWGFAFKELDKALYGSRQEEPGEECGACKESLAECDCGDNDYGDVIEDESNED